MKSSFITSHKLSDPPVLCCEPREVLCDLRRSHSMMLRDISARARVSLGYLSEVEHGQKEASSELLAAICCALDAPVSSVLRKVADRIVLQRGVFVGEVPQTLPVGLLCSLISAI